MFGMETRIANAAGAGDVYQDVSEIYDLLGLAQEDGDRRISAMMVTPSGVK
jgi:hypothetical protein